MANDDWADIDLLLAGEAYSVGSREGQPYCPVAESGRCAGRRGWREANESAKDFSRRRSAHDRRLDLALEHRAVEEAGEHRTDEWRKPEQPELLNISHPREEGRGGAARRIDRRVRDRDADKVNKRQCEPDREAGKSDGRALMRRAEDDDQKHKRHHDLGDDRGAHAVLARRERAEAVRSKTRRRVESRAAGRDDIQNRRGDDRAGELRCPIGQEVSGRKPATSPQPERHGWIEMTARDRPEGVGGGEDREAECKRNASETDPELGKRRGEHCRTAAAEDQPERTEELSEELRTHSGSPSWKRVADGALGLSH